MSTESGTQYTKTIDATGDAGGPAEVTAEDFLFLKQEAQRLVADAAGAVFPRRDAYDSTLFCRWPGQAPDGRKHREFLQREAMPFEGASDMRIRLADFALRGFVMRQCSVLERMNLRVVSGDTDPALGVAIENLVRALTGDDMVSVWRREWKRLLQYAGGDTPGGAVMAVLWENCYRLVSKTLTTDDLLGLTVTAEMPEGDPAQVEAVLFGEDDEAALGLLAVLAPGVKKGKLKAALKDLRAAGAAQVYVSELQAGKPVIRARRLFRDIFFPAFTTDLQRARVIYEREWLTLAELRGRVETHGYDEALVEQAYRYQGVSFFSLADWDTVRPTVVGDRWLATPDTESRRGQVEVITAYYKAVNDDGASCVYMVPFNGALQEPFTERQPLEYAHGDYPFVWYGRETLGDSLWDTRGIPEIVSTDQYALKLLNDSFNDNTTLATLPPRKMPANRPDFTWALAPLAEVRTMRNDDVGFINVPAPQTNIPMQKGIMDRVGAYFGIPGFAEPEQIATISQSDADDFLPAVREVLMQVVSLALQYLPDDELAAKAGDSTGLINRFAAGQSGRYDLRLYFDARTSSVEWVKEQGDLIIRLLGIDNQGMVDRNLLLRKLFAGLGPDYATAVQPSQQADANEAKDETVNFARIMSGDEPLQIPEGQNYALRKQTLLDILQANPLMGKRLAENPDSQDILDRRLAFFDARLEQEQNALIGRTNQDYALGPKGGAAPGGMMPMRAATL